MGFSDLLHSVPVQVAISAGMGGLLWYLQEKATPHIENWLKSYTKKTPVSKPQDLRKFPGVVCNWIMHMPPAFVTTYIVLREGWVQNHATLFADFPCQPKPEYILTYLFCNGYHGQRLFRLIMNPGSDWIEMGTHHVLTMFLLSASMNYGFHNAGMLVLMLNDVSDLFVYAAKFFSILDYKRLTAGVTFPLLLSTWGYFRIWFFSRTVIPEIITGWDKHPNIKHCVYALWGLVGLNVFWYGIFMQMLLKLVKSKGKATRDITDADEDPTPAGSPQLKK